MALRLLPDFDCGKCDEAQKLRRGCTTKSVTSFDIDGKKLWECPLRPYYREPTFYNEVFRSYGWLNKRNLLPEPGTWRDQSPAFLDYWSVIERANNDADEVERQRSEEQARRNAPDGGGGVGETQPRRRRPRGGLR